MNEEGKLTVDQFLRIPRSQLLVRSIERTLSPRYEGTEVEIVLYAQCDDEVEHRIFAECEYRGSEQSAPLFAVTPWWGQTERTQGADGTLRRWREERPLWANSLPVVACRENSDGSMVIVPSSSLTLLMHYVRLQMRVQAFYERDVPQRFLCRLYDRIGSFIREQMRPWRDIGLV